MNGLIKISLDKFTKDKNQELNSQNQNNFMIQRISLKNLKVVHYHQKLKRHSIQRECLRVVMEVTYKNIESHNQCKIL